MSKEQLEELKKWKMSLNETLVLNGHEISEEHKEKTRKYRDLLGYAILQSERVVELENDYVILGVEQEEKLMDELEDLRRKDKRYREFLEYLLEETIDHKKEGLKIQHWALIKDLKNK